jgi:hypothetical protein
VPSSVFVPTSSGGGGSSATYGAAFPASGSPIGGTDGVNFQPVKIDGSGNLLIAGTLSTTPPAAGTCTTSNVAANAASVTVLAANAARLGFTFYNDSDSACNLKRGITASTSSFHKRLLPGESYTTADLGFNYTGRFDCIWDSATGNLRIGEDTA